MITFGSTVAGFVGDLVWEDLNRNGIQEVGEPGIPNMRMDLFQYGLDSLVASTETNEIGRYAFENLPPGNYYIQMYPEDGYSPTLPFQGVSPLRNSDLTFFESIGPSAWMKTKGDWILTGDSIRLVLSEISSGLTQIMMVSRKRENRALPL